MPLTSTERSQRSRQRRKQREKERLKKQRSRAKKRQNQQTMASPAASPDGIYSPNPPVETPATMRRNPVVLLSPIAEGTAPTPGPMTPFQLQMLERSRQRQHENAMAHARTQDAISERAYSVAERESEDERNFQRQLCGGVLPEEFEAAALPSSSTPSKKLAFPANQEDSGAKIPAVSTPSSSTPSQSKKRKTAPPSCDGSKRARVSSTPKSRSGQSTPRSSSKSNVALRAGGSSRKKAPKSLTSVPTPAELAIQPTFAMAVRSDIDRSNILSIGKPGTGEWVFKLKEYVETIHRDYPGRDVYVVGYRDEERPNLLDEQQRTSVPFFAVHTLEKGSKAPKTLVSKDLEKKTEEFQSISSTPFKWVLLHTFPTGETVNMLEFVGRSTKRSSMSQSSITCGGHVYFSAPFNCKTNPGDSFEITIDGEEYYFSEDVWDLVKPGLKEAIKKSSFVNLRDCYCHAKKEELLSIALPCALEAFFEYHDDLDRSRYEETVKNGISEMFWNFRKTVVSHETSYEQSDAKKEDAIHFKIYPQNNELREYLRHGSNSYLTAYAGNATVVYPSLEETPTEA